jgi:hypothetical protein
VLLPVLYAWVERRTDRHLPAVEKP